MSYTREAENYAHRRIIKLVFGYGDLGSKNKLPSSSMGEYPSKD